MNWNPCGELLERLIRALGVAATAIAVWLIARRRPILALFVIAGAVWTVWKYPPVVTVAPGDVAVRANAITGASTVLQEGTALDVPLLHQVRFVTLQDRVVRPVAGRSVNEGSPYQSVEGMSIGVDISVRYAVKPEHVEWIVRSLPADLDEQVVQPAVDGVTYKTFARYSVRDIFSAKRAEIQKEIEGELRYKLALDGIELKSVQIGTVDLPADYKRGMDQLLTQELETERMRYTLELKEKQVKQTELEALADKVRRETAADAAAREQVIAAKAQEEAMKHVLPFKQKQIEQRKLEAEAEKASRIKIAEGNAQARRIEAEGEADSRVKLADAEVYRVDRLGKAGAEQMAREGELLSKHPLLIQKTVADKLSDKVRVIIAPTGASGRFIGSGLIGDPETAHDQPVVANEEGAR
jgi:regulator of protease activity HflC (stomatin/prohibitin superfamily)